MRRLNSLLLAAGIAVLPATAAVARPEHKPTTHEVNVPSRPRLGALIVPLTPELREHFGATKDRGVLVGRVEPKSAAEAAGLRVGDIITEVRDAPIENADDLIGALATLPANDKVPMRVVRDHRSVALTATMLDNPTPFEKLWHSLLRPLPERSPST